MVIFLSALTATNIIAADTEMNKIESVLINKDHTSLEIKGKLIDAYVEANKGQKIYLLELLPYNSTSRLYELNHVAEANVSSSFTFKINFNKDSDMQIFAKYLVVSLNNDGYEIVTGARFIDNVSAVAAETYAYPTYATKKGLNIQMIADAQELGAAHTVVDVAVNEFLLAESNQESETYLFDNKSFYVDKAALTRLDHAIKSYSEAGIEVYLNIKLSPRTDSLPDKLRCLYYDEASEYAKYYAFNTQDQDSIIYLQGFLKFIAERYTDKTKPYGFAGSFIFGYEVTSNRTTNSMGARSLDSYLNSYTTAFRIADTALRSVYSNGRVYISIANNFDRRTSSDDVIADQELDYAGRALLEAFGTKISYSGDIPWNVAINVYSSSRSNPDIWIDEAATDEYDTHYITMKNIDTLCRFLSQDTFLYNSKTRSILISEFAVVSGVAEVGASGQAASIAYAFYKAQTNPMIDAIIYSHHVDKVSDSNKYGLWTSMEDSINTPSTKKTAYNVFKYMDTSKSLESTQFALQRIGAVSSWGQVITNFKESAIVKRNLYDIIPVAKNETGSLSEKVLYEFVNGDLSDFFISDNASYLELRADPDSNVSMLYGRLKSNYVGDYMGISVSADKAFNFKNVNYITVRIKAEAPEEVSNVSVMVRLYHNGNAVDGNAIYEGTTQITAGVWQDVTFKTTAVTSDYSEIDVIKVWIKPYDVKEYPTDGFGIWIEDISTYSKSSFSILKFFLWLILIAFIAVVLFFAFIIIRNQLLARRVKRRRALQQAKIQQQRQMQNTQQTRRPPPQNYNPNQNQNPNQQKRQPNNKQNNNNKNNRK